MKKNFFILFISMLLAITSCGKADPNKNVDEGKVADNFYTSDEIGWTIEIPKGWTVTDKDKVQAHTEKGKEAIEETLGGELDFSKLKNLIGFQKNQFNLFQSTSEPFNIE